MKITFEVDTNSTDEIKNIISFLNTLEGNGTSVCVDHIDDPSKDTFPPFTDETPIPKFTSNEVAEKYGEGSEIHAATVKKEPITWPQMKDGVLIDIDGKAWDTRIHAANQVCTTAGKWRKKRGVTKGFIEHIEKEGLAAAALPPPPPPATPPPPNDSPEEMTFAGFMSWAPKQGPQWTNTEGLNALCAEVGVASIGLLATQPQHIPALVDIVKAARG